MPKNDKPVDPTPQPIDPQPVAVAKPKPKDAKPDKAEVTALKVAVKGMDKGKKLKDADLAFMDSAKDRAEIVQGWIAKCKGFKKAK